MKYDADIQPDADNTSHGIVVDLVGTGREVLDVGCATGYLGRALTQRGCVVTGVEVDPEAADVARNHLKAVHVADLDAVDLTGVPFRQEFDVVVFADVLEHLKDPVRILRSASAVLRPGGFVVISIPNIAHGSVRLSLLDGRFDYREVGLLDDTHIRFFTRQTLFELLAEAGFVASDLRRTTAGVFATEIPVDPTRVPAGALGAIETDEDAETYQFVLAAIPVTGRDDELTALLRQSREQTERLRRELAEIIRAADLGPAAPTVGVLAAGGGAGDALRSAVIVSELQRRLNGFRVRSLGAEDLRPVPAASEWRLAFQLDAIVVSGPLDESVLALVSAAAQAGIRVVAMAATAPEGHDLAGWPGAVIGGPSANSSPTTVPDPAVLGDRLFDPQLLAERAEYLRLLGHLPAETYTLAAFRSGWTAALIRNVVDVAAASAHRAVLVGGPDGVGGPQDTWALPADQPVDVVAAVAGASLVVADDPLIVALGVALGRPTVGVGDDRGPVADLAAWLGDGDLRVAGLSGVAAAASMAGGRAADPSACAAPQEVLGEALDRLAAELTDAAGSRAVTSVPARLRDLQDEVNVLRVTNAGLVRRQRAERIAFGSRAAALLTPRLDDDHQQLWAETERLRSELAALHGDREALRAEVAARGAEAERARAELEALQATRTFRTLRPARGVYRRLRSVLR